MHPIPPPSHGMHVLPPRNFPPPPQNSYGAPRYGGPIIPPPQTSNPSVSAADEEKNQAEMLLKVIQLTDEQINLLPPEDRAKVLELRNQLRNRIGADQTS